MFSIRALNDEDYDNLLGWWKYFRFPAPAKDCLPNEGRGGFMVTKDGIDICAGFLYLTNSKLAWLEFIVSNPDYRDKDRAEAIRTLIRGLCGIAERNGLTGVFTSVKNQHLIKHFEACNFITGSNKTTEMIYKV